MRSRRPNRQPSSTASKRRSRRHPRRDIPRGGDYYPTIYSPKLARRAASTRLWLAAGSASLTLLSIIAALVSTQGPFSLAVLAMMAFLSFNATIALVMSARREEAVHGLEGNNTPPLLECDGVDGQVDRVTL